MKLWYNNTCESYKYTDEDGAIYIYQQPGFSARIRDPA